MQHDSRKIEVYRYREDPLTIYIDVMQKAGDCPSGYSGNSMNSCQGDCQNTFLTFAYNVAERRIALEGALLNKGKWHYDFDALRKHGFDPRVTNVTDFIKGIWDDVVFDKKGNDQSLIYKGVEIGLKPSCRFEVMERYVCPDPEVRQYQELVRGNPLGIMKQGGVEFHGPNGSVVTFRPENIRSMKK